MANRLTVLTQGLEQPSAPTPDPLVLEGRAGRRVDPYWYLRELEDPRTQAAIRAEEQGFARLAERLAPLAEPIEATIRARVVEPDESFPVRRGRWRYLTRIEPDLEYPIHLREPVDGGPRELVLDENAWAAGFEHFALAGILIGDDDTTVVVGTDTTGAEQLRLTVGTLKDGVLTPQEVIEPTGYGFVLSNDARWLLYTRLDETLRPASVWAHRVGGDPAEDILLLEEPDGRFFLDVARTKDRAYLAIQAESKQTSQWWLLDPTDPLAAPPRPWAPREEGLLYQLDHGPRGFVVIQSRAEEEFTLWTRRDLDAKLVRLEVLEPGEVLDGFEITRHGLALQTRREASLVASFLPWGAPPQARILLSDPSQPQTTVFVGNLDLDQDEVLYETVSLVEPATITAFDPRTGARREVWRQRVGNDVDPATYITWRIWVEARDGERVPVTLARRRDVELPAPTLLYAYGAYEEPIDPSFSVSRLSLLDAGVVFAIVHVRGGGELGRRWHDAGRLRAKERSILDLLDATHALVAANVADATAIGLRGASAGGIVVGGALNAEPSTYRAAVLEVPFVDCLSTMSDPTLPLTVTEWEEWGNPLDSDEDAKAMAHWSPYDNIREGVSYPAMLVTTALNDVRVGFFEPLKYVSKLRLLSPATPVWLRIEDTQGHLGPTRRKQAWWDESIVVAFLIAALGRAD
jgi:oligopeptidase B